MAEEKTKGSGTATVDSPGENTVQITFFPKARPWSSNTANFPTKITAKSSRSSTWL